MSPKVLVWKCQLMVCLTSKVWVGITPIQERGGQRHTFESPQPAGGCEALEMAKPPRERELVKEKGLRAAPGGDLHLREAGGWRSPLRGQGGEEGGGLESSCYPVEA